MKKIMIFMNFISLVFFLGMFSRINIPSKPGVTGFVTAISKASFEFQSSFIIAFFIILVTLVLNIYFLLRSRG